MEEYYNNIVIRLQPRLNQLPSDVNQARKRKTAREINCQTVLSVHKIF